METLLKNNDMAKRLDNMKPSAFAQNVRRGRFSVAGRDEKGHALFDPVVVLAEYNATKVAAAAQNHAQYMPEGMRGGRPKKSDNLQTNLFSDNNFTKKIENNGNNNNGAASSADEFLKIKIAKERAQALLLKQKVNMQAGKLILKTEAQAQGARLGEIVLSVITSWPTQLAQEFEAMGKRGCDGHDFQHRLTEECNKLIIDIRNYCEREVVEEKKAEDAKNAGERSGNEKENNEHSQNLAASN